MLEQQVLVRTLAVQALAQEPVLALALALFEET